MWAISDNDCFPNSRYITVCYFGGPDRSRINEVSGIFSPAILSKIHFQGDNKLSLMRHEVGASKAMGPWSNMPAAAAIASVSLGNVIETVLLLT